MKSGVIKYYKFIMCIAVACHHITCVHLCCTDKVRKTNEWLDTQFFIKYSLINSFNFFKSLKFIQIFF